MKTLKPLTFRDWSKGTWRGTQNSVAPANSVRMALNMDSDAELGSLKVRPGITQLGSQLSDGYSCYGLHYYINAVTPAGSRSPSLSRSISPSVSPSKSISPSISPSVSPSASRSPSVSPSVSPSASQSPSNSPSLSTSQSISPSISPSVSPSQSLSPSASPSKSHSVSPSVSPSAGDDYNALLAVFPNGSNNIIYEVLSGDRLLSSDTKNLKTRFLTYLDDCLRLNGTDGAKAWNGTEWITTGGTFDVGNFPTGATIAIEWKDRVYTNTSASPDKAMYSGIADATARTISWTSGNGYIMMEQEDGGGGITAYAKCPGYLLVFKKRSLKRWDGSSTYPDDMVRQGTPSQECVCYSRGMVAWINEQSIWATVGGMPKNLGDARVRDFVQAITDFSKVCSSANETNLFFYIGDVTVGGINYYNVMLKYNLDYQTWDIRSYYQNITAMANYVDRLGKSQIVVADNDGNVAQMDLGVTDMGKAIPWNVETHNLEFSSRAKDKKLNQFFVHTEGVNRGTVLVRTNSNEEREWKAVGKMAGEVSNIQPSTSGRYFNFKVTDSCDNGEAKFLGLEFPDKSLEVLDNV